MKKTNGIIAATTFALSLTLSQGLAASVDNTHKSAGIAEALELYGQALPMDINSLKRAQLLDQAEGILQRVIEKEPRSLEAHRKLLAIYLLKQDYNKGIKTMQSAITLSPDDPKLFISLAILYQKAGALELASKILDQAIALDPNHEIAKEYKVVIEKKIQATLEGDHGESSLMGPAHGKGAPASMH